MMDHIRQRGSAWELRAYSGTDPVTGRKKYVTRTVRGSRKEAERALVHLLVEVTGGAHAASDATVTDLVLRWFELAKPELSPSTIRGYERIINNHILPILGKTKISRLKAAQIDHFYAMLRDRGGVGGGPLSPASVRQVHAILRRALQQGVKWEWISSNPAALATTPKVRQFKVEPPDPAAVMKLIEVAAKDDLGFACFLIVAATTGARRGELCALRWSSVNFDDETLTIAGAVVEGVGNQLFEKDTKTHGSRKIAIDELTVATLNAHSVRCELRAQKCGAELKKDAFIFSPDANGRRPAVPNDVTKEFMRLRDRAGLESVRLHDLRHFAATRLLSAGVSVRTVSGRLGHASASMTLGVYAHFLEVSDREAADALGLLITPISPMKHDNVSRVVNISSAKNK
ncbi:MAG TPA: site-specific integrase [Acidimicrobiales bacterium]